MNYAGLRLLPLLLPLPQAVERYKATALELLQRCLNSSAIFLPRFEHVFGWQDGCDADETAGDPNDSIAPHGNEASRVRAQGLGVDDAFLISC